LFAGDRIDEVHLRYITSTNQTAMWGPNQLPTSDVPGDQPVGPLLSEAVQAGNILTCWLRGVGQARCLRKLVVLPKVAQGGVGATPRGADRPRAHQVRVSQGWQICSRYPVAAPAMCAAVPFCGGHTHIVWNFVQ
jgi:hypothetical protein